MIELRKGNVSGIKIIPRGFNKSIFIDEKAFEAIKNAQKLLKPQIKLIITRGYQPENWPINIYD